MRKVRLGIEEQLWYRRDVVVTIPDDMSEREFEQALDWAQCEDSLDGFIYALKCYGIECSGGYDHDLSSPSYVEVECDEYEFLNEDGDQT